MNLIKSFFVFCLLSFTSFAASAEIIVLSGVYQGKDVYVKNPETASGVGFCVFEVLVNGQVTSDEVNSPAFAIDLKAWALKIGDPVEIVLRCKEDCEVKIINPEVIYPNSTFEIVAMELSPTGLLTWTTTKETATIPFNIEQFKWNKWVKVGEIMGQGAVSPESTYSFQAFLTSGSNQFRIQQIDHKGAHFSKDVTATSATPPVTILDSKIGKALHFSAETNFEIYSEFGELIRTGRASVVDASAFFKGRYYINFDNKNGVMVEKK